MKRFILAALAALALVGSAEPASAAPLGKTTTGSTTTTIGVGALKTYRFQASSTASVNRLNVYLPSTSTAATVVLGLYSTNAGNTAPDSLVAACPVESATANAWNSCNAEADLVNGTYYWLGVLQPCGDTGTLKVSEATQTGVNTATPTQIADTTLPPDVDPCAVFGYLTWSGFPDPWTGNATTGSNTAASVYADWDTTPPSEETAMPTIGPYSNVQTTIVSSQPADPDDDSHMFGTDEIAATENDVDVLSKEEAYIWMWYLTFDEAAQIAVDNGMIDGDSYSWAGTGFTYTIGTTDADTCVTHTWTQTGGNTINVTYCAPIYETTGGEEYGPSLPAEASSYITLGQVDLVP